MQKDICKLISCVQFSSCRLEKVTAELQNSKKRVEDLYPLLIKENYYNMMSHHNRLISMKQAMLIITNYDIFFYRLNREYRDYN